jgi:hypothetical protein
MRWEQVLLVLVLAAAAAALPACETTQQTSERLSKNAGSLLAVKGLKITRENAGVKVQSETVLHDPNGVAAVIGLRNTGPAQAAVPVAIDVRDAKGHSLYENSVPGLDPSLTSLSAIGRGARTFWVNNQIQTATAPRRVSAKVGVTKKPVPGALPKIDVAKLTYGDDVSGVYARGVIANRSKIPQRRVVVACVALRGSKVVAAGRAIVEKLQPAPTPKPVTFRVYFIGDPKGGTLSCVAPPTVLAAGSSS